MRKPSSRLLLFGVLHLVTCVILVVLLSKEPGAPLKALHVIFRNLLCTHHQNLARLPAPNLQEGYRHEQA